MCALDITSKWLLIWDMQTFRDRYFEASASGQSRWRWDSPLRAGFFKVLAKVDVVLLLATCWSDAEEVVFLEMEEFYKNRGADWIGELDHGGLGDWWN